MDKASSTALQAMAGRVGYRAALAWLTTPQEIFAGRTAEQHLDAGGDLAAVLTAVERIERNGAQGKGGNMPQKLTGSTAAITGGGVGGALATLAIIFWGKGLGPEEASAATVALSVVFSFLVRYVPAPRPRP